MPTGGSIAAAEARAALAVAADLADCRRPEDLEAALRGLPGLLGAEYAGAGELRRGGGDGIGVLPQVTQPYVFDADALADWAAHHHQHPVLGRLPDAEVRSYADFLSAREWRKLGIYSAYRRLGLRGELSLHLAVDARRAAVLTVHRVDRGFGERERELLGALAPHLRAAYLRLEAGQEAERWRAALEQGLAEAGACVVLADAEGRMVGVDAGAEEVLHRWFGAPPSPELLPAALAAWAGEPRRGAPARPFVQAGDGVRLEVLLASTTEEERLLVLRERRTGPPEPAELARAFPVTPRQAEVLALLGEGRSDAEIAHRLGISVRTVGHHVEHLLDRLGVSNRTAAAGLVHSHRQDSPLRRG
jgi:DNA-binding CsgD family transcriptional regulator